MVNILLPGWASGLARRRMAEKQLLNHALDGDRTALSDARSPVPEAVFRPPLWYRSL
jgi:hypothetical protein